MEEQMEEQITLDLISTFSDVYNSDPQNKMIEDKITKNGLEESLINKTIIKENKPVFNIELPDSKRYDQKCHFQPDNTLEISYIIFRLFLYQSTFF